MKQYEHPGNKDLESIAQAIEKFFENDLDNREMHAGDRFLCLDEGLYNCWLLSNFKYLLSQYCYPVLKL